MDETQAHGQAIADALALCIRQQPPPIPPKTLLIAMGKVSATCFAAIPPAERDALAQRWVKQILWLADQVKP